MTNYDLDTKEGMNNARLWLSKMIDVLSDGAVWAIPRSGTSVRIDKAAKVAYITRGFAPDRSIERVFRALGWDCLVI